MHPDHTTTDQWGARACHYCGEVGVLARGLCVTCYKRQAQSGTLVHQQPAQRKRQPAAPCWHCGHIRKPLTHDLCTNCYRSLNRKGYLPRLDDKRPGALRRPSAEEFFLQTLVEWSAARARGAHPERWVPVHTDPPEDGPLGAQCAQLLATLPPSERTVIIQRFGLDGTGQRPLSQIGQHLGLSRQRVQQLFVRAMWRLVPDPETHDPHGPQDGVPEHTPATVPLRLRPTTARWLDARSQLRMLRRGFARRAQAAEEAARQTTEVAAAQTTAEAAAEAIVEAAEETGAAAAWAEATRLLDGFLERTRP